MAESVRGHRERRKMSAQQLSDACGRLGYPIPRSVLTNLENGRREAVSVAEWLVLSAALGVPPLLLIFPVGRVDVVEPVPGVEVSPLAALHWVETGRLGAAHDAGVVEPSPDDDAQLIKRYRRHQELVGAWKMASGRARYIRQHLHQHQDGGEAAAELTRIEDEQQERAEALRELREVLRSHRLTPPELPRSFSSSALRQALGEDDEELAQ